MFYNLLYAVTAVSLYLLTFREVIDEKKLSYNYLQVEKRSIKILILAPSRELVAQIYETFLSFLPHILVMTVVQLSYNKSQCRVRCVLFLFSLCLSVWHIISEYFYSRKIVYQQILSNKSSVEKVTRCNTRGLFSIWMFPACSFIFPSVKHTHTHTHTHFVSVSCNSISYSNLDFINDHHIYLSPLQKRC